MTQVVNTRPGQHTVAAPPQLGAQAAECASHGPVRDCPSMPADEEGLECPVLRSRSRSRAYRRIACVAVGCNGTSRDLRNLVCSIRRILRLRSTCSLFRFKASETRKPVLASRPNNVLYSQGSQGVGGPAVWQPRGPDPAIAVAVDVRLQSDNGSCPVVAGPAPRYGHLGSQYRAKARTIDSRSARYRGDASSADWPIAGQVRRQRTTVS